MKYIKTFENFNEIKVDIMREFVDWVSNKIDIKIGKFIGKGVEGSVYDCGLGKVIKFTHSRLNTYNFLLNKNIDGIVKIYHTGIIHVPIRFKYTDSYDRHKKNQIIKTSNYSKFSLSPNNSYRDNEIGYVIMEKLNIIDMNTINNINKLDIEYFFEFVDSNLIDYDIDYDIIYKNFFIEFNKSLKGNKKYINLVNEYRKFLIKNYSDCIELYDRIKFILKNSYKEGLLMTDIHPENFTYNTKKELVLIDPTGILNNTMNYSSVKNIVRECQEDDYRKFIYKKKLVINETY